MAMAIGDVTHLHSLFLNVVNNRLDVRYKLYKLVVRRERIFKNTQNVQGLNFSMSHSLTLDPSPPIILRKRKETRLE